MGRLLGTPPEPPPDDGAYSGQCPTCRRPARLTFNHDGCEREHCAACLDGCMDATPPKSQRALSKNRYYPNGSGIDGKTMRPLSDNPASIRRRRQRSEGRP